MLKPIAQPGTVRQIEYQLIHFMMFAPLEGWRRVKVTDRHTAVDYV